MPDPHTALLGSYATPEFTYGDTALDLRRGPVVLGGLTDAPIPWPVGKQGRHKALVLYGALAKAVRRESASAVAHWWGVSMLTVWAWRKALGVGTVTEGTSRLKAAMFAPHQARV